MDVVLVKREENSGCGRRRLSLLEAEGSKCVKRRRRDPLAMAARSEDNSGEKQMEQSVTPIITTTTTNVTTKRSSRFRGVSRHRWTGRFEAHLWDKGSWNATQKKKGKQVYLGAYDEEESAARAYDMAALKYWGPTTFTNFPVADYEKELQIMQNVTKEEYLASLRRKSSGFSRGVSKYRGVARHHHNGRWEARIGRVFGNKYLYLGTYSTQEEAAAAYDIAAIEYRGINAVTNFDLSTYIRWLRPGANTHGAIPQPKPRSETPLTVTPTTHFHNDEPGLRYSPFIQEELCSPEKQEALSRQFSSLSSCSKSASPTALSLLLRSSVFRELVEKNPNASETEIEGEENVRQRQRQNPDDEYAGVFYDGIGGAPFVCSNNGGGLEEIEAQEEGGGAYYGRLGQSLWSSVLSMGSIQQ